jgi:peptidoglycan DL-endopeptidase CwlO
VLVRSHLKTSIGVAFSLVLVTVLLAPVASDAASTGASLSAKKREAARLSDRIDATSARIEALNEDFLVSRNRLQQLQKRVARASVAEAATTQRLDRINGALHQLALEAFTNPAKSIDALGGASTLSEAERQLVVTRQGTQRLTDVADALRAGLEDRSRATKQLRIARDEMRRTSELLDRQRSEADRLADDLAVLEQKVDRQLSALVEKDRTEREVAEQKRVEAEQRRRRAAAIAELRAREELRRRDAATAQRDAAQRRRGRGRDALVATGSRDSRISQSSGGLSRGGRAATNDVSALEVQAGILDVPGSPGAQRAVNLALGQLGKPYIWGADGPGGFDCSGLMLYAWRSAGKALPHSSRAQFSSTSRVPIDQIRPGDLVFYGRPIHHVGMYIGGGMMVEASRRGKPVRTRSIFRKDLVGVGRVR